MTPKLNIEAAAEKITQEVQQDIERAKQRWSGWLQRWISRITNPAESSYQLGAELLAQGNFTEAKFRLKFTLWRQPNHIKALHNLAICHFALGEVKEGVVLVQNAIRQNPKDESSRYLLATVEGGKYSEGYEPHTTPVEMIKNEFHLRAAEYEAEEVGESGYRGHLAVYDALSALAAPDDGFMWPQVLDAGCGTGLVGGLIKPIVKKLHGVDLSADMLAIAGELRDNELGRKIYDTVTEADVRSYLLHLPQPAYHAIVAANLAPLMGGLAPFLDGAVRGLHPSGWVVFNYRPCEKTEGYQLLSEERRFAHSEAYVRQVIEKSGLRLHSLTPKVLYENEGQPSSCIVVCAQKP